MQSNLTKALQLLLGEDGMDKATRERFAKAVEARKNDEAFFATKKEMEALTKDDLVEFNEGVKDGNKIAFRATEKGLAEFDNLDSADDSADETSAEAEGTEPSFAESPEADQYEIEEGIPVPEGRRRTGPKMKYPFDRLKVGQSFFVAATDEKPEPWKSMASTVSTAMRRYSVEDGKRTNRNGEEVPNYRPTRVFRLDEAEKDGEKGARIWRVA